MSQENDYDFRDQHNILILEMLTNPYVDMVTKNLLRSVISHSFGPYCSNLKIWT